MKAIQLRHDVDSCRERIRHIEFLCMIDEGDIQGHLVDLQKARDKMRFLRKELCEAEVEAEKLAAVELARMVS